MPLVDSHCHLDDYTDLEDVLTRANASGVTQMLAVGIGDGPDTMHRALELAHTHAQVFASAGIHPQEAHQATTEHLDKLQRLVADSRCIAVGEIGLDYYHLGNPEVPVQHAAFVAQMKIATEAGKPIIIHCRASELANEAAKQKFEQDGNANAAWDDLLNLLEEHWVPSGLPGIMHCFSGNEEQAARSLEIGFYLSFAGNLTYPKSTTIQAVAKSAPSDRILVETDAPFLTPIPHRGQRNEPAHVALTASFLAELRGVSPETLSDLTTQNFHALFPSTAR